MDFSKFDSQIEDLIKQIKDLREQLKKMRGDFMEETKEFAAKWFQDKTKKTVISKPEQAKKLGEKGLKNLKSELQEEIKKIPEIVNEHVDKNEYWMPYDESYDYKKNEISLKFDITYEIPKNIEGGIRKLFGYAGAILKKYDFITYKEYGEWEWAKEQPKFSHGFDLSKKMNGMLSQYKQSYGEYIELSEALKNTKQKRAEAEAGELWNKS